ncbi:hypothetical protein SAY87_030205 [Trapa incisa]|uniref:Acid phosphatase/vanadium-dependent haloperoxidase-related protein n=1 Tax=Trapa incisa TaxID=236973 RepID=A0AAN7KSF6_9MYRT|nr:hypothetical protein SAY87_030205 [Trapa incisa]
MGTVALGPLPMCCSYPLSSRPGIARLVSNRYSPTPSPGLAENVKRGRSFSISASSAAPAGPNSPGGFWGLVGAIRGLLFPNGGAAGGDLDGGKCLQSGGIGVALLSLTATARMKISPAVSVLAVNPTFLSGLLAWFTAQSSKVLLNFFLEKKLDLRIYFGCGGMPSSHSALCTALTTSVGLCHGMADSLFAVCLGFSLIVMYDAIGVRRHAGLQAEVLNVIIEDLFQGHPISRRKLRELLGHTPSQVLAGALIGIAVACFCHRACLLPV